ALVLPGCAQYRTDTVPVSTPTSAASGSAASVGQSTYVQHDAIWTSKATGPIRLISISGNPQQCRATKLFIGLADSSDLRTFEKLIVSRRMLDAVMIDDPTSGHHVYKLRGVIATGKNTGSFSYPVITLEFAKMAVTGC